MMRDWTLASGDPLLLTLAADSRFSKPDVNDDQIWELEAGGGDPPALALYSTYGLRARSMRIFPRFLLPGRTLADPALFARQPLFHHIVPNFLALSFSPVSELEVEAEYWVPGSHAVAGRFTLHNRGADRLPLTLEICGLLVPLDGQSLSPVKIQSTNVLAGRSGNLSPLLFMTGGPQAGLGPYPALTIDLLLEPGSERRLTWVHAACSDPSGSFDLARYCAASSWDAEIARIDILNTAQTVDIHTGDPDWDAALAFSQNAAFTLFMGTQGDLPEPSFVLARQPEHGFSLRCDGLDHPPLWSGCSPLEAYYLTQLLPGAPQLAVSAVKNFLAARSGDGEVDLRPGMAGQRGHRLATPILAAMVWQAYEHGGSLDLIRELYPDLLAFHRSWFSPAHDRDQDGFPEWSHPDQAGLEEHLAQTDWQTDLEALFPFTESPALAALLYKDALLLDKMASLLPGSDQKELLKAEAGRLHAAVDACWDTTRGSYVYRDRDTHQPTGSMPVFRQRGNGQKTLAVVLDQPTRLLLKVFPYSRKPGDIKVTIQGRKAGSDHVERFTNDLFSWSAGYGIAISREPFTALTLLDANGLGGNDRVTVQAVDLKVDDLSLLLPLWAGIPDGGRAGALIRNVVCAADRFSRPFGLPTRLAGIPGKAELDPSVSAVQMPLNHLIGEALLSSGFRSEAAQLTAHLMSASIRSLKERRAFSRSYQADSGAGLGDRNNIYGFAPVNLFLKVLGVDILFPRQVIIRGKNPFPWPVTVQYRGMIVTRDLQATQVSFADGQTMDLVDPVDVHVFADQ